MKLLRNNFYIVLFVFGILFFFSPFFLTGKVPIPADDLIGLFHPWRDEYHNNYPNGIPFKNPLITDPIRQQYPYRIMGIRLLKNGKIPSWNPFSFSGTPLLANIQAALFYPGNLLFLFFGESIAWSLLVFLQPVLALLFTYYYLLNLGINKKAAVLGGFAFAFSGFMIAWLTWNTIGHVALWLPLVLLAKDKIIIQLQKKWILVLILAESALWLGGHLQTSFYVFLFSGIYLGVRLWKKYKFNIVEIIRSKVIFWISGIVIVLIVCIQLLPTIQFIFLSSRSFDLASWQRNDWFLPLFHLVQFFAPDFFGNPATNNYWGIWNYGEFVGFIGIIPLFFAFVALLFRRDKKTLFYGAGLIGALILALPTPLAQVPYRLSIPFLSTLQPSRILILICFCGSILGAFGFDYFISQYSAKRLLRQLSLLTIIYGIFFVILWIFVISNSQKMPEYLISKRNLFFPSGIFLMTVFLLGIGIYKPNKKVFPITVSLLLFLVFIDQFRFAAKFTPFVSSEYIYPETKLINFLQKNSGNYRYMTTDRRILPPNTSILYELQTVDGYDPLYLRSYAQMVSAWTRNLPQIEPGAFNRILTPERYDSFMTSLFGVKYVITFDEIINPQFKLVLNEGETNVYENLSVFPRAFLLEKVTQVKDNEELMINLFKEKNLLKSGFTTYPMVVKELPMTISENVIINKYSPDSIELTVTAANERILMLTDPYYPNWKATVDDVTTTVFPIDLFFRGIKIPPGDHVVKFYYSLVY